MRAMAKSRRRIVLVSLTGIAAVTAIVAASTWMPVRLRIAELLGVATADDVQVFPGTWYQRIDVPAGERDVVEVAELLSRRCDVNLILPGKYEGIPERQIHIAADMRQARPETVISVLRENGWRLRRGKAPSGSLVYTFGRKE